MLVYMSSMMALAPVVAPIVGAGILRFTSWRGTFVVLGVFGVLLLLGSLLISEPSKTAKDPHKTLRKTFSSLKTLAMTPGFAWPMAIFSIAGIPILMFVGSASDIYITGFGLSEQAFSLFFGFNAAVCSIGPFAYIFLARRFSTSALIRLSFILATASGLWVIFSGNNSPLIFALAALPYALGSGLNRPPSMNILLEQGRQDTGAASSLINFTFLATGCLGLFFISMDWENRIFVYGLSALCTGLFAITFWSRAWQKCNPALLH